MLISHLNSSLAYLYSVSMMMPDYSEYILMAVSDINEFQYVRYMLWTLKTPNKLHQICVANLQW